MHIIVDVIPYHYMIQVLIVYVNGDKYVRRVCGGVIATSGISGFTLDLVSKQNSKI